MHWARLTSDSRDAGVLMSDCSNRLEAAREYAALLNDEDEIHAGLIRVWEEGTYETGGSDFAFSFRENGVLTLGEVSREDQTR